MARVRRSAAFRSAASESLMSELHRIAYVEHRALAKPWGPWRLLTLWKSRGESGPPHGRLGSRAPIEAQARELLMPLIRLAATATGIAMILAGRPVSAPEARGGDSRSRRSTPRTSRRRHPARVEGSMAGVRTGKPKRCSHSSNGRGGVPTIRLQGILRFKVVWSKLLSRNTRRRSQVVRQRSAKPRFVGSIPTGASHDQGIPRPA